MHQCLKVQEIFHLILTHVFDPKEGGSHLHADEIRPGHSQRSLAAVNSLARTCKTFCDPALDVLWHYQTNLKPLLKCLPKYRLVIRKHEYGEEHLVLNGRIDTEDFNRLDCYARRIHILGNPNPRAMKSVEYRPEDIDPILYPTILSRRSAASAGGLGPLLPNLTDLNIEMIEFCALAWYPRLVAGPQLKFVKILAHSDDIFMGEYRVPWANVLSILSPALPNLKHLSLSFSDPLMWAEEGDIYQVKIPKNKGTLKLLQGVLSITSLNVMSIQIDMETLLHIASIRTITVLDFNVSASDISPQHPTLEAIPELPNLVELSLCTDDQWLCSSLIRRICPRNLKKLKAVNPLTSGDGWDIDSILQILNTARFTPELQQIDIIKPNYDIGHNPTVRPISSATIDLLAPFSVLSSIRLYQNGDVHFDRECLDRIALRWPTLKVLDLRTRARLDEEPLLTLYDMFALVAMLPSLEEFRLRTDAEIHTSYAKSSLQLTGVANEGLKHLDVCTSPILSGKGRDIATLLAAAFPSLRRFDYGFAYSDGFGSNLELELTQEELQCLTEWKEVATALSRGGVV